MDPSSSSTMMGRAEPGEGRPGETPELGREEPGESMPDSEEAWWEDEGGCYPRNILEAISKLNQQQRAPTFY